MLFHQFGSFHRLVKLYKIMKLVSRSFSLKKWFSPIGENTIFAENIIGRIEQKGFQNVHSGFWRKQLGQH